MKKTEIVRITERLRDLMGLNVWEIELEFDRAADRGDEASVTWNHDYDSATIRLRDNWQTWTLEYAYKVIAHELTHLQLRGLNFVMNKQLKRRLAPDVFEALKESFDHELEGAVDRISRRFVALAEVR